MNPVTVQTRSAAGPEPRPGGSVCLQTGWPAAVAILLAALLTGCATSGKVTPETERRTKFIRTQTGDQVTLQWESAPGQVYRILYATDLDRRNAWRAVPGYEAYRALDRTTRVTFTAPYQGPRVYYRLEEGAAGTPARRP